MEVNPGDTFLAWKLTTKPTCEPPIDKEYSLKRLVSQLVKTGEPGKDGGGRAAPVLDRFTHQCFQRLTTEQKNKLNFFASRIKEDYLYLGTIRHVDLRNGVVDSLGVTEGRLAIDTCLVSRRARLKNHNTNNM